MSLDILTANFFEIFSMPVSYEVDIEKMQIRNRELQKACHPDKFVDSSAQEKRLSMQHTSRINEAYNTLKDPVERALYMLKLKGLDINFDNETTMDAEFLMEQMELREELSVIRQKSDPLESLDELKAETDDRLSKMMGRFSKLYAKDDLDAARELIRKLQFTQKASREIETMIETIEDEMME